MIKQINEATGEVEYVKCTKCGMVANFDTDTCPEGCKEEAE